MFLTSFSALSRKTYFRDLFWGDRGGSPDKNEPNEEVKKQFQKAFDEILNSVQEKLGNWALKYLREIQINFYIRHWDAMLLIDSCIHRITQLCAAVTLSSYEVRGDNVMKAIEDAKSKIAVYVAFLSYASQHPQFGESIRKALSNNQNLVPSIIRIIEFCNNSNVPDKNVSSIGIDESNTVTIINNDGAVIIIR